MAGMDKAIKMVRAKVPMDDIPVSSGPDRLAATEYPDADPANDYDPVDEHIANVKAPAGHQLLAKRFAPIPPNTVQI